MVFSYRRLFITGRSVKAGFNFISKYNSLFKSIIFLWFQTEKEKEDNRFILPSWEKFHNSINQLEMYKGKFAFVDTDNWGGTGQPGWIRNPGSSQERRRDKMSLPDRARSLDSPRRSRSTPVDGNDIVLYILFHTVVAKFLCLSPFC